MKRMAKRERIKGAVCAYSTGTTAFMTKQQQEEISRSYRLMEIRKIEEYIENNAPVVHTTTVVYNPNRHKYAIVFGKKIRINNKSEWKIYFEQNFKIVDK